MPASSPAWRPSGSRSGSNTVIWAPAARGARAASRPVSSAGSSPPGAGLSTAGMTAGSRMSTSRCSQYPSSRPVSTVARTACATVAVPASRTRLAGTTWAITSPASARWSSSSRQPTWTASSGRKYGLAPSMSATAGQCRPTAAARSSPARLKHSALLPGCRKSVWPSRWTSPYRPREASASPAAMSRLQSPPSTSGARPASSCPPILAASRRAWSTRVSWLRDRGTPGRASSR